MGNLLGEKMSSYMTEPETKKNSSDGEIAAVMIRLLILECSSSMDSVKCKGGVILWKMLIYACRALATD